MMSCLLSTARLKPVGFLLLVILGCATLVAGCGGDSKSRSAELAASPSTKVEAVATETPWNPIYGYDAATSTGTAAADKVMAHIAASNLDALAAETVVHSLPCSLSTNTPTAERCPAGAPEGTRVQVVYASFCAGTVPFPLEEVRSVFRPLLEGHPRLWGLRELPPNGPTKELGTLPPRYVLFVVNDTDPPQGFVLSLGEDGSIYDVQYGCDKRPEEVWAGWDSTGRALLTPPSAPRPR